jgi:hypothetical protein
MSTDKKMWKHNPVARDLATRKYHQRIKRQKSPYADDNYDIHIELLDLDNPESTFLEKQQIQQRKKRIK